MPANRSRTTGWRRSLQQINDRNGSIELAIASDRDGTEKGGDLIWRSRLMHLDGDAMIVERPMALGQELQIDEGVELIGIMAIGQNRWMFSTVNIGNVKHAINSTRTIPALKLKLPAAVERCQRRNFYRVETAALVLPEVEIWPLLDPKSVMLAERANEIEFEAEQRRASVVPRPRIELPFGPDEVMPDVGPRFAGRLVNIGGGGLGMHISSDDSSHLHTRKLFWLRFSLPPELSTPICATSKLVHTHMEADRHTYAGFTFEFTFNPSHRSFVVDQICRYIAVQQRAQLQRHRERLIA